MKILGLMLKYDKETSDVNSIALNKSGAVWVWGPAQLHMSLKQGLSTHANLFMVSDSYIMICEWNRATLS